MTALATPTTTIPFRNSVTSSSSSLSSSSPRRNAGRTITLLLSLAVACCLLASSTSTLVAATPIPKIAHHQRQQRSLLQQVHHVQIADESVHNSMVLMKKSIQKRKQQQIKQQQQQQKQKRSQRQQQQQASTHKQNLQKRAPSVETPSTTLAATVDSLPAATVDSLPADDLVSSSTSGSETVQRSNGSKVHKINRRDERSNKGSSSSSTSYSSEALSTKRTKNPKSQGHFKARRAKLISAYEAIVFSESQLPVFWSHDHPSRPQQKVTKNLQKQRPKAVNLESKASETNSSTNKGQDHKIAKAPVASDGADSSLKPKVPKRGNERAGEKQGHGQGVASHPESDKNRRATVEVVPVSVTADAQEQLRDEPREHLLPQQAKRASLALDGSGQPYQRRRRQYAPEGVASFLDHGCRPSSAMMISGALVTLLLVSYKIYKRAQRQRQMAGLMHPSQPDHSSLKAPLTTSAL
ncbi:unnamed protein product [Mortierella alpina]